MSTAAHLESVRRWYPNALSTVDTVNGLLDLIASRFGLQPRQLMHADSLCCDDVNAIQYPPRAYEMLGPFKLGGLDGFPFAGVTGMGAFAHHVPEDGAVVVFYAPHIGITQTGSLGEIHRIGQRHSSACCGAARAALGKLLDGQIEPGHLTDLDHQMNVIEQLLLAQRARIVAASAPMFEATEVIYEAIDARIEALVERVSYPCRYVFLIGAVFINGDAEMGSFCAYKKFEVIDRVAGTREGLMEAFRRTVNLGEATAGSS